MYSHNEKFVYEFLKKVTSLRPLRYVMRKTLAMQNMGEKEQANGPVTRILASGLFFVVVFAAIRLHYGLPSSATKLLWFT